MARRRAISIPEDIIAGEIVLRLPVKSVGRCRCVCKRWRFLFSDPDFAKSHIQSASKQQRLVFHVGYEFHSQDLELGMQKSLVRVSPPPFKNPKHALSFVGSCNGLVACVSGASIQTCRRFREISLFIWNPLTGFYREFLGQGFYSLMRGFGHVSGTDDYKVVQLLDPELIREIRVFSLSSQTWKSIKCPLNLTFTTLQVKGVFLNEALHWLAYETDRPDLDPRIAPVVLFVFDLAKEEFRKVQVPRGVVRCSMYDRRLGVSCEGCLYIMCFPRFGYRYRDPLRVEFWVMREYGNIGNIYSWNIIRIRIPNEFTQNNLEPILLMETCAVVMDRSKKSRRLVSQQGSNIRSNDRQDIYMIHHHTQKENLKVYIVETDPPDMIVYEESLFSLC
ncbi:F-box/kelch-repeat protein At3g06240-like [Rosa rugosa]|uniref:F-box/kelch-repeat protein At3g06240-like n=1 Tax=Rosa rugosa TaxID=74645 RepID=UPI002B401B93|nr:F-box/kelch-repeat protein At3g06240-like [Rosa rugosa]